MGSLEPVKAGKCDLSPLNLTGKGILMEERLMEAGQFVASLFKYKVVMRCPLGILNL